MLFHMNLVTKRVPHAVSAKSSTSSVPRIMVCFVNVFVNDVNDGPMEVLKAGPTVGLAI